MPDWIFQTSFRNGKLYMNGQLLGNGILTVDDLDGKKKEEKSMRKFKVGDIVVANKASDNKYHITTHKNHCVAKVVELDVDGCFGGIFGDADSLIRIQVLNCDDDHVGEKYLVDEKCFDLDTSNRILIMRDKKDPQKVVAKNLVTNETAEAKCNPEDTFDFATGAKLALNRLCTPAKYWTAKVICVENLATHGLLKDHFHTVGKVYEVKDGVLYDNTPRSWEHTRKFESLADMNDYMEMHRDTMYTSRFIEYKGGAD